MTTEGAGCCETDSGCITCGDVAVPLTVVSVTGDDALCRDGQDRQEWVAAELVGGVRPGDVLLVHAGVALQRLGASAAVDVMAVQDRQGR